MTKLEEVLGLPSLDEEEVSQETTNLLQQMSSAETALVAASGSDHAAAMDKIYAETLQHAQSITDLAYNIEPARAPRMFEVGAIYYKAAMEAANSKRDAQLKTQRLAIDHRKQELAEQLSKGEIDNKDASAILIEDRNEIIKRAREEAKLEAQKRSPSK